MISKIKELIFKKMFVVSRQPVLFKDLLEANSLFNEGMLVDPSKLNFRFRYGRFYALYSILCFIFLSFIVVVFHEIFEKIDFHFSIICTMIITALVFVGFDYFKIWARKSMSKELIMRAWKVHFPYFPYDKYSQKIEIIYNEAIKKEIPKKDLEKYVLDQLVLSVSSA
ncbi:membrane protein [Campylobacter hyointestinalis]|uniref:hypothetical protein n=1 Tax=Campylobacter hyointestinalis TaxID=198 RepID=UPI0004D7A654|nr:hypothetical protein [Campylobacter hyointestinalis]KEA43883.1 membrane protein [Campylobacter hyointestinalis subsp. hyointestinalis]QKF55347.1 putative membrane protein [Campylobacter hyointestinalis subsp. hyointestinalis]TXK46913.1 hypothetical protein A0Z69_05750 [Campylobacter hyointestinalis]SFT65348.1 hypothetical protein SAMN05421691_1631 [Campylobacter hyointestinalis]SUW90085.1 membrane protein [Campylobacter hyointestinalis]